MGSVAITDVPPTLPTANGPSCYPLRRAVTMQSEQNLWRHSLVVIVFFSMSRQMGHMSSECSDRGETAISVPSMMASWAISRW